MVRKKQTEGNVERQGKNKYVHEDNHHLGFSCIANMAVGYDDDIHGPGAEIINGFQPTRRELRVIAEFWYREVLDIEIFYFLYQQYDAGWTQRCEFASNRLNRIKGYLGKKEMERIVRKVDDESEARLGQEYWRIYKEGTPEERDRVAEEMDAALTVTLLQGRATFGVVSAEGLAW